MDNKQHIISAELQRWYTTYKRDLPWRSTRDPYIIWVSEVVLQQTRVAQGLAYFNRFVERFPEVHDLAAARQEEVLKLWQGLGYYSRARNMHTAAQQVMKQLNGVFPHEYKTLLQLKGVGEYTAAAVASISANAPVAVVDGNVDRVISRLFCMEEPVNSTSGKKKVKQLAESILDKDHSGNHNQAVMELGALICTPKNPDCTACPLERFCQSRAENRTLDFPVKQKKVKQRKRFFQYFFVQVQGQVFMGKRPPGDIWEGLYQLVLLETEKKPDAGTALMEFNRTFNLSPDEYTLLSTEKEYKHVLSHQVIFATFYALQLDADKPLNGHGYEKFQLAALAELPIARITDRYFKDVKLFD